MHVFAATSNDYSENSTSLSVFEYKLDKFNDDYFCYYDKFRKLDNKNDERIKALSYINYVSVKKGKEPQKLFLTIQLTPFFHSIDVKEKARFSEIIIDDTLEKLKNKVSPEITKEHLFGSFDWMAFSNTLRKAYDGKAIINNGIVIDVKVNTRDYYDCEIKKELINLHDHIMIQVTFKQDDNAK
jgi:hypothetical protein